MLDYSTFDIINSFKGTPFEIKRERLKDWMDRGYVVPSTPAAGKGIPAEFTILDIYNYALFSYLVNGLNMKREAANKISSYLRDRINNGGDNEEGFLNFEKATNEEESLTYDDQIEWIKRVSKSLASEIYVTDVENKDDPSFSLRRVFEDGMEAQAFEVAGKLDNELNENKDWSAVTVINLKSIVGKVNKAFRL